MRAAMKTYIVYDGTFEMEFLRDGETVHAAGDGSPDAVIETADGPVRIRPGTMVTRLANGGLDLKSLNVHQPRFVVDRIAGSNAQWFAVYDLLSGEPHVPVASFTGDKPGQNRHGAYTHADWLNGTKTSVDNQTA